MYHNIALLVLLYVIIIINFHDNYAVIISLRVIQCRLLLIINLKKYRIVQFIDRGKSDGPRYLLGSI